MKLWYFRSEIISITYNRAVLAIFRKNRLQLNEHSHQAEKLKPNKNKISNEALFIVNNNIKDYLQLMVATT